MGDHKLFVRYRNRREPGIHIARTATQPARSLSGKIKKTHFYYLFIFLKLRHHQHPHPSVSPDTSVHADSSSSSSSSSYAGLDDSVEVEHNSSDLMTTATMTKITTEQNVGAIVVA